MDVSIPGSIWLINNCSINHFIDYFTNCNYSIFRFYNNGTTDDHHPQRNIVTWRSFNARVKISTFLGVKEASIFVWFLWYSAVLLDFKTEVWGLKFTGWSYRRHWSSSKFWDWSISKLFRSLKKVHQTLLTSLFSGVSKLKIESNFSLQNFQNLSSNCVQNCLLLTLPWISSHKTYMVTKGANR